MLTSWPVRQEEVARDAGATWESRPSSRGKSDSERKITREPISVIQRAPQEVQIEIPNRRVGKSLLIFRKL